MMSLQHSYLGTLDIDDAEDDVCWKQELSANGKVLQARLWADQSEPLNGALLDKFAAQLARLDQLDREARTALAEYLDGDRTYISFHLEEIEDADYPENPAEFAQAMRLKSIDLWSYDANGEDEGPHIIMDYNIDPENTDELLAVRLNADGKIEEINWES